MLAPETALALLSSAPVVWLLTQAAKKLSFVPVFQGQKTRIRAVAGVLSSIIAVVIALTDDNLSATHLQTALGSLITLAYSWGGSHLIHDLVKTFKKEKE